VAEFCELEIMITGCQVNHVLVTKKSTTPRH